MNPAHALTDVPVRGCPTSRPTVEVQNGAGRVLVRIQAVVQTVVETYDESGAITNRQQLQAVDVTAMSAEAWLRQWDAAGRAIVEALGGSRGDGAEQREATG